MVYETGNDFIVIEMKMYFILTLAIIIWKRRECSWASTILTLIKRWLRSSFDTNRMSALNKTPKPNEFWHQQMWKKNKWIWFCIPSASQTLSNLFNTLMVMMMMLRKKNYLSLAARSTKAKAHQIKLARN